MFHQTYIYSSMSNNIILFEHFYEELTFGYVVGRMDNSRTRIAIARGEELQHLFNAYEKDKMNSRSYKT